MDIEGIEAERLALLAGLDAGAVDLAIIPGEASYQAYAALRSGASASWSLCRLPTASRSRRV
uniref:hypothetical protein n=1 Tax=Sphingomonas sp. GlSt437 TaxID=3389970 RepID=UPI003A8609BB